MSLPKASPPSPTEAPHAPLSVKAASKLLGQSETLTRRDIAMGLLTKQYRGVAGRYFNVTFESVVELALQRRSSAPRLATACYLADQLDAAERKELLTHLRRSLEAHG